MVRVNLICPFPQTTATPQLSHFRQKLETVREANSSGPGVFTLGQDCRLFSFTITGLNAQDSSFYICIHQSSDSATSAFPV